MSDTSAGSTTLVLYDGARGGTPDTQGRLAYRASPGAGAAQTFEEGSTILDTWEQTADAAGYFGIPSAIPTLDRAAGYALRFTAQLLAEDHSKSDKNGDGYGDRAGFSVLVLSGDARGIELGFWPDEVWAQEDGPAEPPEGTLFTRAESARFDTAGRLVAYTLAIRGDGYELSGDGAPILYGRLRDYRAFEGPVNPYRTPNFVFLGDDTGSARARIRLAYVALDLDATT